VEMYGYFPMIARTFFQEFSYKRILEATNGSPRHKLKGAAAQEQARCYRATNGLRDDKPNYWVQRHAAETKAGAVFSSNQRAASLSTNYWVQRHAASRWYARLLYQLRLRWVAIASL
jgi:hypothetical protein